MMHSGSRPLATAASESAHHLPHQNDAAVGYTEPLVYAVGDHALLFDRHAVLIDHVDPPTSRSPSATYSPSFVSRFKVWNERRSLG